MDASEYEYKDDLDKLIEALAVVLALQAPSAPADAAQARQTAKAQIQRALDSIIDKRLEHGQGMNRLRQPRS